MARNYRQAALRHMTDAMHLASAGRYDDAGHLIGFAAECALKEAATQFTKPRGLEIEGHFPQLKMNVQRILEGRNAQGPLLSLVKDRKLLDTWHVNDRYQEDGHVGKEVFEDWKKGAEKIFGVAKIKVQAESKSPQPDPSSSGVKT